MSSGAEEPLLPVYDDLGAGEQGGAALLHRLNGPLGLFDLVGEVLLHLRVSALLLQLAVVAAEMKAREVGVLIGHGQPLLVLDDHQVGDQVGGLIPAGKGGAGAGSSS